MLVDEKGKPLSEAARITARMLSMASGKLFLATKEPLNGPFSPGAQRVRELRKSCGVKEVPEGGGTVRFRRYGTLFDKPKREAEECS